MRRVPGLPRCLCLRDRFSLSTFIPLVPTGPFPARLLTIPKCGHRHAQTPTPPKRVPRLTRSSMPKLRHLRGGHCGIEISMIADYHARLREQSVKRSFISYAEI